MHKIQIKPLSVNEAWKGKKYKTDNYRIYERSVLFMLPKISVPRAKLELNIKVGYSSQASDLDNACKPFQDILSKKYGFNDNQIYKLTMQKEIVAKGLEYISFDILKYKY